jgi:hypothetical protein
MELAVEESHANMKVLATRRTRPLLRMVVAMQYRRASVCCMSCAAAGAGHSRERECGTDVYARFYSFRQCWASKSRGL